VGADAFASFPMIVQALLLAEKGAPVSTSARLQRKEKTDAISGESRPHWATNSDLSD
jgi:hypothetical protein